MRTYKQLQDIVLQWMADTDDLGLLRTLVKDAINRTHQTVLTDDRYDFMLWPQTETISVTADQKVYALHPEFYHPLFFYNPTSNEYLEEIPPVGLMESQADWDDGQSSEVDRFMLTGLSKLQAQPAASSQITIVTSGTQNPNGAQLRLTGISNGVPTTELVQADGGWSQLTSTTSFSLLQDVTKVGTTWNAPITLYSGYGTANQRALLQLNADEYGKQFRMFELLENPTTTQTVTYRFYRKPRQLVYDGDIPDIPAQFDDILVYQTLIAMAGYTRATPEELGLASAMVKKLTDQMQQSYRASRSMGGRPTYVRYIPRV